MDKSTFIFNKLAGIANVSELKALASAPVVSKPIQDLIKLKATRPVTLSGIAKQVKDERKLLDRM